MKHLSVVSVALCTLLFSLQVSVAQERKFGLGIIIGEPTGVSAKLWTSGSTAFDAGLGWSVGGDRFGRNYTYNGQGRIHIHVDYLWHAFGVFESSERFPVYYGIGGRMNNGGGYDGSLAVRGVIGVAWLPRSAPMDVFLELAPSLQLTSSTGFALDAGIGARYYF